MIFWCLTASVSGQGLEYLLDTFKNTTFVSLILQIFILSIAVGVDPYILKKKKRIMFLIIALVLSLMIQNRIANYLEFVKPAPFARTIESIWGYTIRPVVIVLFLYLVHPDKRLRILWLMVCVNAAIYLSALFSRLAFWITPDNHFIRGPLTYSSHITCTILIMVLLWSSFREWNHLRRAELLIPVMNALLVITAMLMDSFILHTEADTEYLTVTIVSCSIFYYIWLHLKFVLEHEDMLQTKQRVQIMLSQIQPHFLYNTLGAIREMYDDPEAKEAVGKFARYLQGNMDAITESGTIPFAAELDHTKAYLELEQLRFEDALLVEYDITCADFRMPTLTLQPIVENAVRHGVRVTEKEAGTVTIATRKYPDRYEITVSDDGPGFDPDHPAPKEDGRTHIGIQNVRERLKDVCGGELRIESVQGKGTKAVIILPKTEGKSC